MNKVVQSFSKSGRPHDNAVAESFFASMKREEVYRTQYCSEHQFMRSIDTYIEFYNTKRPHSTLNYKTPDGFRIAPCAKERAYRLIWAKGSKLGIFRFSTTKLASFIFGDMDYRVVHEERERLKYQDFLP